MARFLQILAVVVLALQGLAGAAGAAQTLAQMLALGSLGNDKAPVTVIEYASLTCPHCAAFAKDTFEAFKQKYIDTGKVYYTFRDFPFDQPGLHGAMMARCAGPDQYFGLLAVLFKSQDSWATAPDPTAELAKIGRLAGLDKEAFDACMADKALQDGILKGEMDAQHNLQVDATPTFIVNGVRHSGNMPLEEFDTILAPLLK